eukprot:2193462-Amphidinium_carterae.2
MRETHILRNVASGNWRESVQMEVLRQSASMCQLQLLGRCASRAAVVHCGALGWLTCGCLV